MLLQILNEGDKIFAVIGEKVGLHGRVTKTAGNFQGLNSNSSSYQIIWQNKNYKYIKEILKVNENGLPQVADPVLLLDRDYNVGTRVVNAKDAHGIILGVEKVATLSIEILNKNSATEIKLEKIPLKLLKRPLEAEVGEKFLWNDWLGKIQDLTVTVMYYFEDSDTVCSITGEEKISTENQSHKHPFPFVGQEFSSLRLTQLWDADWEDNKWFRNMFKYLGKKAKVIRVTVDSITPEWIRRIPYDDLSCDEEKEISMMPKFLLGQDLEKVQYLYGKEYCKMEERSLCRYSIQGTDRVTFFNNPGLGRKTAWEYSQLENKQHNLELNVERVFTVVNTWNRYFIEWSNGIQEFCYIQETGILATAVDPANISLIKSMSRGSIVEMQDSDTGDEDTKYGIVLGEDSNRIVSVKWVIPNGSAVHMVEMENSRYDLKFSEKYQFLEDLSCFPVVFVKNLLEVGVVTDLDVENTRLKVKLPNGTEIFPYIHECTYMENEPDIVVQPDDEDESDGCEINEHQNMDKIDLDQLSFDPCTHKSGYLVSEQIDEKHIFYNLRFNPRINDYKYLVALEKELASFNDLPEGIWLQGFANRSDLFTAIIRGKSGTPYQDALLVFDLALPQDFPMAVPNVIFRAFGVEINPKIVSTGEVILPTYDELITLPSVNKNPCIIRTSLSWIKNEILVNDPYYLVCQNGRNSGDTFGDVHCKRYNEFILLNLLTYQQKIVNNLPSHWESFFMKYYCENLSKMVEGYESLLLRGGLPEETNVSERGDSPQQNTADAFYISLRSRLDEMRSSTLFLN